MKPSSFPALSIDRILLIGFWIFFINAFFTKKTELYFMAGACLISYWGRRIYKGWRLQKDLHDLARMAGLTDADIEKMEQSSKESAQKRKIQEKQQKQEKLAAEAEEKAYQVTAQPTRIPLETTLAKTMSFPTESANSLTIQPGSIQVELLFKDKVASDETQVIQLHTYIIDQAGDEWLAETYLRAATFLDDFTGAGDHQYTSWKQAPDTIRDTVATQTQISEVSELLDSRSGGSIQVDGVDYPYYEKYQGPEIDIAWNPDSKQWIARVSGLYRDYHEESDLDETIPPFIILNDSQIPVLFSHPEYHAPTLEDLWEEPEDRTPITFKKTGSQGTPQNSIQYS